VATGVIVGRAPVVDTALLRDLVISPDGRRLYVLSSADLVSVVDLTTTEPVGAPIAVGPSSCCLAVSPDGSRVYVSNGGDISVIAGPALKGLAAHLVLVAGARREQRWDQFPSPVWAGVRRPSYAWAIAARWAADGARD
jgi:DNA-binding beta-propeller fold protein YncE